MLRSGESKAVNTFLTLCGTYLANDRARTMQGSAGAATRRHDDGDLTTKMLADCMPAPAKLCVNFHLIFRYMRPEGPWQRRQTFHIYLSRVPNRQLRH